MSSGEQTAGEQKAGEQNAHEAEFDKLLPFVLNEADRWNEHKHQPNPLSPPLDKQEGAPPAAHAAPDRLRLTANTAKMVHEMVQWRLMQMFGFRQIEPSFSRDSAVDPDEKKECKENWERFQEAKKVQNAAFLGPFSGTNWEALVNIVGAGSLFEYMKEEILTAWIDVGSHFLRTGEVLEELEGICHLVRMRFYPRLRTAAHDLGLPRMK